MGRYPRVAPFASGLFVVSQVFPKKTGSGQAIVGTAKDLVIPTQPGLERNVNCLLHGMQNKQKIPGTYGNFT
jgi:hypothetical protein